MLVERGRVAGVCEAVLRDAALPWPPAIHATPRRWRPGRWS
jgi:hypothetical protein